MMIKYDIEKINTFLYDFYNITGLTVSIWDTEINRLSFKPDIMAEFCKLVRSSEKGRRRCLESDRLVCSECKTAGQAKSRRCHAGITDTAIPLMLGGQLFGFMMFGQARGKQDNILTLDDVKGLADELGLSAKELYEAYLKLETYDIARITSTIRILTSATGFLFDSGSIKYTNDELINGINDLIEQNIAEEISVSNICEIFGIDKNRLYRLWRAQFGTTIGKYILDKRMLLAKKLLLTTDRKINSICVDVGIPDYNYFTKVYKKYYGLSPSRDKKRNS